MSLDKKMSDIIVLLDSISSSMNDLEDMFEQVQTNYDLTEESVDLMERLSGYGVNAIIHFLRFQDDFTEEYRFVEEEYTE